jgi:NarL family two-component system response regulator LiaR
MEGFNDTDSVADVNGHSQDALRAIVADDDALARHMVKTILQDAGMLVVAEASNGREAVELALFYEPDVVLMDVVMPEMDGITATRRIVRERPSQVVIVLTGADDDDIAMTGLNAGASGYLTKDLDVAALPRAVEAATAGEAAISRSMSMRLIERLRMLSVDQPGIRPVRSALTRREWEVLDLLCERKTTDEIAEYLVLSTETVRSHIKRILRKLGVRSRAEAVAKAHELRTFRGVPASSPKA